MNFKWIDPCVCIASGALIAISASLTIPASTSALGAMFIGGIAGMIAMIPLVILLVPLFGAFEMMIPLHLIAMPAGMLGGMLAEHSPQFCIAGAGALWGTVIFFIIWFYDRKYSQASYPRAEKGDR
ncbi:MAG: hypothetical protein G3M78_09275 [Candidatus Nitrohelix vancouverensis]|uniref:Uncharacterized protein n=1 Tax=Candidatus Nitrohelix vancouverensis TaxID=2705534 RepID=A0A7T0C305_9BACT|nr:MAG: hypothetical protein G3M78_09275 [Candidatus Nitrohelix vancouverensis]